MSLKEGNSYKGITLLDVNSWARRTYGEIQNSGAPEYEPTSVEPLDAEYRKEIGAYLRDVFNLDNLDTMYFIKNLELTYHDSEDVFIASDSFLDSKFNSSEKAFMAHEQGHRLGNKIIEDKLEPLEASRKLPAEPYRQFFNYLKSEDFAERTKLAIGETLGEDFEYNESLIEDNGMIYSRKGRFGPEELVDPERDENLDEMMEDIERLLAELAQGEPSWT